MVVALVALVAGSEGNPGSTDAGTGKESCHVHCSFTPVWLPASGERAGTMARPWDAGLKQWATWHLFNGL